jgi:hypothetical protein
MKDNLYTFLVVVGAILVTGFILDEVGNKNRLGNLGQVLAKKITSGYGA